MRRLVASLVVGLIVFVLAAVASPSHAVAVGQGLSPAQRAELRTIARDTWRFYSVDVDPTTHLPLDNVTFANGAPAPTDYGRYTSAANVGVYLWAVVAANDLGLISRPAARSRLQATLNEVARLPRFDGFLYQWYDTTTGHVIRNPGDIDCRAETTPTFDNCYFISNVDNGWYASGLIVARQALPELARLVDRLTVPMNFGIFYDDRPETHCNTNPTIPGNQPTGQMFGGYYVGLPPDQGENWTHYYHNGSLYSDPRISAYLGMGLHQMPGNVWWRSWRELPPPAPFADCQSTDPDFSWQGQWPMPGSWQTYTDPKSGQPFPVWEGHYVYPGTDLTFIPTFAGGMFEGLMANEVVPETTWGPRSFGVADARTVQVQIRYATQELHYPVWGMSPSSTPDDTGGYASYGAEGLTFPYFGLGRRREPSEPRPVPVPWLRHRGRRYAACVLPCPGCLPAAGLCQYRDAAQPVPGRLRRRRFLRRGEPVDRSGWASPARARPVDDHGRARQRAERPGLAATLRPRSGVMGGPHLPRPRRHDARLGRS